VYSVEIFADGFVKYVGIAFVEVKGQKRTVISTDSVDRLVAEFVQAGYFEFNDNYETQRNPDGTSTVISDLPTTVTSLRIGDRLKTVVDYAFAPPKLWELEWEVDRVAGTHKWIDGDKDNIRNWEVVGPDVYQRIKPGMTVLMQAAGMGDITTMETERAKGANINASDETGWTALMLAAAMCRAEAVKKLLDWGADFRARDKNGDTALMAGAAAFCLNRRDQQTTAVRALLESGADPNEANSILESPLMTVTTYGNIQAMNALLEAGARTDVRDSRGRSPFDYATDSLAAFSMHSWANDVREMVAILAKMPKAQGGGSTTSPQKP
jgi:hypothetical protein